jgi:hypothetical protein
MKDTETHEGVITLTYVALLKFKFTNPDDQADDTTYRQPRSLALLIVAAGA